MLALAATTFFTSCSSDDDIPDTPEQTVDYLNGIFVLNQGNFGAGNASVTFVDENLENVTQNVFSKVNDGDPLGDTAQSMAFLEDYAWIVVNVSNKIEVVDRNTFESIATIDAGLVNPRYVAFSNGNAYVTNWGDGGNPNDDYLAVIDVETFEIEENIGVEEGPENILSNNGRLYVAHQGGYSQNNKVSVIDAGTNTLAELLEVGDVPSSLAIEDNSLWVLSAGVPAGDPEYSPDQVETAGRISQIDLTSLEVVNEYDFPVTDHPSNLILNNGRVFYTLGDMLYTFEVTADFLPEEAQFQMEGVGYPTSLEIEGSRLYATSAGDNQSNGTLYVYDLQGGDRLTSLEVGIIPGEIYFNN